MRDFNWNAFWTGIFGAATLFLLGGLAHSCWNSIHDRIYNEGYERGVEVGTACPNNRTFHCTLGDPQ